MIKELSKYENLGTVNYFWEFYSILKKDKSKWTLEQVEKYFINRVVDGRFIFDGCLSYMKWLKDRRDRKLSYDEVEHYQKIIVALVNTDRLMKEIDDEITIWPIK